MGEVLGGQPKLTFQLRTAFTVLSMPTAPDIKPGSHCVVPITCEFFDRCNTPLPDDHIGYLPRLHASAMEELEEMGIESIREIPDDFELSEIQRRAATCVQTGEPWFSPELSAELDKLEYPLRFVDFETINPCVPRFVATIRRLMHSRAATAIQVNSREHLRGETLGQAQPFVVARRIARSSIVHRLED